MTIDIEVYVSCTDTKLLKLSVKKSSQFIVVCKKKHRFKKTIMSTNILLIFVILIYAMPSLANELCRNGTGYLSMLNQTKIISNFTNENGNITILVDQDSEFNFTCHNNNNSNKTKILFVSENPDPFLVKCDGVCQVNIFKLFC